MIEAMSNDIIDAKIDQVAEQVIIKTSQMRNVMNDEWALIAKKI